MRKVLITVGTLCRSFDERKALKINYTNESPHKVVPIMSLETKRNSHSEP